MKLDQYIAAMTSLSRRKILDFLTKGKITVNNKVVDSMALLIQPGKDIICIDNEVLTDRVNFIYLKGNKPKHFLTTMEDPKGRESIKDAFPNLPENVFPVGRLDRKSSGLLLFTNDGNFSNTILHPEHKIRKRYVVELDRPLTDYDRRHFEAGIILEDGPCTFLSLVKEGNKKWSVIIDEGRNRIVRRAFDFLEYKVIDLKRTSIGDISLGDLKAGELRKLTQDEIVSIRNG